MIYADYTEINFEGYSWNYLKRQLTNVQDYFNYNFLLMNITKNTVCFLYVSMKDPSTHITLSESHQMVSSQDAPIINTWVL